MVGWPVGVAVDEGVGACGLQPGDGGGAVHIGVRGPRLLARLALLADAARLHAARGQRLGQKLLLPGGAAGLQAKTLVVHIVQAQQVAVAQDIPLAAKDQDCGVCQAGDAAPSQEGRARQEVAVAMHEVHRQALRGGPKEGAAPGFEAAGLAHRIVAHPHFEQVAQDKEGVCGGAFQILLECGHRGGLAGLQVQV